MLTAVCNSVWKNKRWPNEWKKSVYVPIHKKGDKKECGNYRTIALIPHASKILLRILQKRLEYYLIPNLPREQAGFRKGRGTRDHIANLRWMMEEAREFDKVLVLCFIVYKKAFDCVDHDRLWVVLSEMGAPRHLVILLKMLYQDQKATVRTESGETDTIPIRKGVRQGCILSALLFNIYAEKIMRDALELWEGGVRIGGQTFSNLRYADDTTLLANNEEEIKAILTRVKSASETAGLFLNISKTKILTTGAVGKIEVSGVELEVVDQYQFLGVLITSDGSCEREIRRRIALGRVAMSSMSKIWRDRG